MEGDLGGGEGGVCCLGRVDEGRLEGRVREDVGEVGVAVRGRGDRLVSGEGRRVRVEGGRTICLLGWRGASPLREGECVWGRIRCCRVIVGFVGAV